jgi:HprK-related kinase A
VQSRLDHVAQAVELLYADHPLLGDDGFFDFHVRVDAQPGLRRYLRPQAQFEMDGHRPFSPMAWTQAAPMLEWGLNWCVTEHAHQFIVIHAAAIERGGKAALLPAPPGSGKSTLCAALVNRGWRLLSDELALIDLNRGLLLPLARPVSLKNRSIEVIRAFAPEAQFSEVVHDTLKGSVAHMKPPPDSVRRDLEPARLGWIVFPRYRAGSPLTARELPRSNGFMQLLDHAFNYHLHGNRGFECLADMVEPTQALDLSYSRLDDAIAFFDRLAIDSPHVEQPA